MASALEQTKELILNRTRVYSFLSRVFRQEADSDFLSLIKQNCNTVRIEDIELEGGFEKLRLFFARFEINEQMIEGLAADYADLFLGIGRHPAHPYESVYLGRDGIIMQEPWNEVRSQYRSERLGKTKWFKEPEDHVALEFDFMVYLCLKILETLEKGDTENSLRLLQSQRDFLMHHLKAWIPAFCDDILKSPTEYEFYDGIAEITKRFTILEDEIFTRHLKGDGSAWSFAGFSN